MKQGLLTTGLTATVLALTTPSAHAYIDPGTGSFIVQGIIAGVIAVGMSIKIFWHRIRAAVTGRKVSDEDDD